jgi:NADH:ubiquinone reductase (H+-translocating)
MAKTRIVIVGGGAAGFALATRMGRSFSKQRYEIVLVDKSPTHVWKPLLHEVAAGALDAGIDEINYQAHASAFGYKYVEGTLAEVEPRARVISLHPVVGRDGDVVAPAESLTYDYLVLAIGSVTNDFGTPGVREHCVMLDSREQADEFRRRFQAKCLRISRTFPFSQSEVHVVIVGGGATGVELAAELCNAAKMRVKYGMANFVPSSVRITLLEMGKRILPALPERLAAQAADELSRLGVDIRTEMSVASASASGLESSRGEHINADIVVWAAGVRGTADRIEANELSVTSAGKFDTRNTLQVVGSERIFAMGDCAHVVVAPDSRPVPPRAQAAHQMADVVFENVRRLERGLKLLHFEYRDRGTLVSLSQSAAVGTLMGRLVSGSLAVQGRIARVAYNSLYSSHIKGVLGWRRWVSWLVVGYAMRAIRPRTKLH